MSLPQKLARGVGRPVARAVALARHSASYPFDTPLTREIHRLERRWGEKPLRGLAGLPGLEPGPRLGLAGLAYQVVAHYKPRHVVQLGTRDGLATLAIATALRDNAEGGRLQAVDPAADPRPYEARLEPLGLGAVVEALKMSHDDARARVARPVDLLLIDAGRPLAAVEDDWESFGPIVRPGGLALFVGVKDDTEARRFWRSMTRMHENHTVRRKPGLGVIRVKQQ